MKALAFIFVLALGLPLQGFSQIPVEIVAGHERATLDFLFFSYFKKKEDQNSRFLFFSRNRASIDYEMTESEALPTFAFTEAISYNHKKLKGLAPVVVGQVFNRGVFSKAGIQYVHNSHHLTFFTWSVVEIAKDPEVDYYFLLRYTPEISSKWGIYSQIESLNAFPTLAEDELRFFQSLRIGLDRHDWQIGPAADLSQRGRNSFSSTANVGLFLRHEF